MLFFEKNPEYHHRQDDMNSKNPSSQKFILPCHISWVRMEAPADPEELLTFKR